MQVQTTVKKKRYSYINIFQLEFPFKYNVLVEQTRIMVESGVVLLMPIKCIYYYCRLTNLTNLST